MEERKQMGKVKDGVMIPVAADIDEFGGNYREFIDSIKENIKTQHTRVLLQANREIICLYWQIGKAITQKQVEEGWGTKVIDRISHDLRHTFPEMKGFSPRNIKYMKKFACIWQDESIVQQVVDYCLGEAILSLWKNCQQKQREFGMHKKLWSKDGAGMF